MIGRESSEAARAAVDPDLDLVDRFRAGERRAFDELVRRYQRPIYYLSLRYLKNEADAKDISQRAFVRAFKALDKFRGSSSFRTWLYRIAINLSLNHLRDNRRMIATDIPDDALMKEPVGVVNIIAGERSAQLRGAITELPPKQRLVLELRVYDEMSFREIASVADCTENAAKVNFHHAVKRLRSIMTSEELS